MWLYDCVRTHACCFPFKLAVGNNSLFVKASCKAKAGKGKTKEGNRQSVNDNIRYSLSLSLHGLVCLCIY